VNLKKRLSSTEDLLRAIRSGEPYASQPQAESKGSVWTRQIRLRDLLPGRKQTAAPAPAPAPTAPSTPAARPAKGSPTPQTPPHNVPPAAATAAPKETPAPGGQTGDSPDRLLRTLEIAPPARAPAKAKQPFWLRPVFGGLGKPLRLGVSVSGPELSLALLRVPAGALLAARRFPMTPAQAPGEKGFPEFLRACLRDLSPQAQDAEIWAVLRSSDLDLNVLAVPKLSGGKLDAAVYWTLQKEKKFAEAEYVLDYLVMGPTKDPKDSRLEVLTCLARRADVDRLREAFRDAGRPLAGVTAIPNAFLNLYHLPGAPKGHALAANIHVEPDFSAIGLYTQDRLVFSRFIRSGTGSMAEALADYFQELSRPRPVAGGDLELPLPGEAAPAPADEAPPVQPLDADQALALFRHVLLGAPRPEFAQPAHLLTPEAMLDVISPAIERLARQVDRTLEYYATSQQARCDAMHLSGEIFASPLLAQALGSQLGMTPLRFDATAMAAEGGAEVADADRMSLAPAMAAALSQPDRGINLLATYKNRTAQAAKRKATQGLILGLAAVLIVIGAAGLFLERANTARRATLAAERAKLAAFGPMPDERGLMARLAQFKAQQEGLRQAAVRYQMPAIVSELGRCIPPDVRLLSVTADLAAPPAKDAQGKPQQQKPPAQQAKGGPMSNSGDLVVLEGIVTGDKSRFDATLSRFVIALQASPLFSLPLVTQTELRDVDAGGQALYFILHMGVK